MANYLVTKNYSITDHTKWYNNRTSESDLDLNYKDMEKIMLRSAKRYLRNCDNYHTFTGKAENIREVFVKNFYEIYNLWKEGHNILYVDADVVFINEYNVFDEIEYFSMFNYAGHQHEIYDEYYNIQIKHFFNCGIRYYPKTMNHAVWELGLKMLENFNYDRWDCEQVIYNVMQWSQSEKLSDFYRPQLAFQMLYPHQNQINVDFNTIFLDQACAVHMHASRNSLDRLNIMNQLEQNTYSGGERWT